LVDRLLTFLADFPLPPSVVLTPTVAAVAPPLTRWSSAALHIKPQALIRTMKMSVPTMGPNTDFKQWQRNFLNFLSLKAPYLIP
jgi:hypothetical protein